MPIDTLIFVTCVFATFALFAAGLGYASVIAPGTKS